MSLVRIEHHPSSRQLTVFASLWLLFLGGWSLAWAWSDGWTIWSYSFGAAALVAPILRFIHLESLRRIYVLACYATLPIGWVVSHLLLGTIYYGVMTPIAFAMRLVGYDPMTRKLDKDCESYWVARDETPDPSRYFKQF